MASTSAPSLPGLEDLPNAPKLTLASNITLQPPLSRRGHGPGLIIVDPGYDLPDFPSAEPPSTTLDPAPQYKWAEEGYAVVRITIKPLAADGDVQLSSALEQSIQALNDLTECDTKGQFALLIYGTPDEFPPSFEEEIAAEITNRESVIATVSFTQAFDFSSSSKPQLIHQPGKSLPTKVPGQSLYTYPEVSSSDFVIPGSRGFSYSTATISHTRSITFIKKQLNGPHFDLEQIWDEHTYYEFENRSVEKTMATMVREPYVNHIPTMTGGIGRSRLTEFYRDHFIWNNPDDTALELISRTIGVDRIVDEFIFIFTHTKEIDWLIPGIPPTNLALRIPFHAVVNIRGDRLYHEHIGWDQATVLKQLGMMPEYLAFPHTVQGMEGKLLECKLPIAGVETAMKMQNQRSVESNTLFVQPGGGIREHKDI